VPPTNAAGLRAHQTQSRTPQLQASNFRHAAGVPRRIPHHLDIGRFDPRDAQHFGAHILLKDPAHSTTRRGHRHLHLDLVFTVADRRRLAHVHQPQIHDIHRNLRVKDGAQLRPYFFLFEWPLVALLHRLRRRGQGELLSEGIGIPPVDPDHPALLGDHRIAATQ
jgi:hypothetical protein